MPKILIADDSLFMRKILMDILNKGGFTDIIEASNGKEVLEKIETEKPDLILLDIIMPVMDGMEVLRKIEGQESIIAIISAVGQEEIIKEAKNLGAKSYLVKPFKEIQVLEEVKKLIK